MVWPALADSQHCSVTSSTPATVHILPHRMHTLCFLHEYSIQTSGIMTILLRSTMQSSAKWLP